MIEIKLAVESDAETLSELSKKTFLDTFSADNSKEDMDKYVAENFGVRKQLHEIQDPNRWIAIAWSQNTAVGFFHLVKSSPDESVTGSKPIELLRLYVDSRWHGKGVGAKLLDQCIALAREKGFRTLWLGVWEKNFRAQAFYKKYAFTFIGQHIFKLGADEQIDLIMALEI